jgi:hypothetical protein
MGVRILIGHEQGQAGDLNAAWFDSTTDWMFGPLFTGIEGHPQLEEAEDEADAFLAYVTADAENYARLCDISFDAAAAYVQGGPRRDPRKLSEHTIENVYGIWRGSRLEEVRE